MLTGDLQKLRHYNFSDMECWCGLSNNSSAIFMFDDEDYNMVSKYCWYENNSGYMITRISKYKQILLHRMIVESRNNIQEDECVDHINRSRLDCRRSNLRICNKQQNAWNVSVHSNSKSGILGVRWHDKTCKWNAYITLNGKFKSLGYYDDILSAIQARKAAEIKYRGEFAPQ